MNNKKIKELFKFGVAHIIWIIIVLAVFLALFVGFMFCGYVIQKYTEPGKNPDIYLIWFPLLASGLIMIVTAHRVVYYLRQKQKDKGK